jgi:ankyrin repeat protein
MAALSGSTEQVKLLLDNGANREIRSETMKKAVDFATAFGYDDIVALLHV